MTPFESKSRLTVSRLKECLHYDPSTGLWTWLNNSGLGKNSCRKGKLAGELKQNGYIFISVDCERHRAHRLAWLYMTGEWATQQIDHRSTIRSDNRWENLRLATNTQQQGNRRRSKNNRSGFKGVFWNTQCQKWHARISPDRKQIHLGYFKDVKKAAAAYEKAAMAYFKDYARSA